MLGVLPGAVMAQKPYHAADFQPMRVIDHHREYNITTVNLSPVDDKPHAKPVSMMRIFQKTGVEVYGPATKRHFKRLDLLAAVDHVFGSAEAEPAGLARIVAVEQVCAWPNEKQPRRPKQAPFRDAILRSWVCRSDDDGRTWQGPQRVTGRNEIKGHLLRLNDGRVLLSYGARVKGKQGVCAKPSAGEGRSWRPPLRLVRSLESDCGYNSGGNSPRSRYLLGTRPV